jgi:hypothetical protein
MIRAVARGETKRKPEVSEMRNERNTRLERKMIAMISGSYPRRNLHWTGDRKNSPMRRVVRSSVAVVRAMRTIARCEADGTLGAV